MLFRSFKAVLTNTAPTSAYRGAGRPEAIFTIERLMDEAARQTGIDHIADAWHGQRGLGDICGQHDAARIAGFEDALLLLCRQACIQRQYLDMRRMMLAQGFGCVAVVDAAGKLVGAAKGAVNQAFAARQVALEAEREGQSDE